MSAALKVHRSMSLRDLLFHGAAFVVIIAGLKAAAPLIVLFLLAIFLVVLAMPAHMGMLRRGVPPAIALLILVAFLAVVGGVMAHVLRLSMEDIYRKLPSYQVSLQEQVSVVTSWLTAHGVEVPNEIIRRTLSEKAPFQMVGNAITTFSKFLGRGFIVILIAAFMLMEATVLPAKLKSIPGVDDRSLDRFKQMLDNIRVYIGMKTVMSLLTGVLVGSGLFLLDVDNAVMLGILAFLLNYIPNIGSFMAGIPGVLLAFIQFGFGHGAVVLVMYVVVNVLVSNVIEPRYMGRGLGLSPMIIVMSLMFWAWVLGPVGMLLSIPLTMVLKIAMESMPETRGYALLLGGNPEARQGDDADQG
ncbi:MAG: AI-2E family transporter [Kiritimatiellae bacterium]|nr:AI-2E family transporter [Kiritimatiellia bacterium]